MPAAGFIVDIPILSYWMRRFMPSLSTGTFTFIMITARRADCFSFAVVSRQGKRKITSLRSLCLCGEFKVFHRPLGSRHGEHREVLATDTDAHGHISSADLAEEIQSPASRDTCSCHTGCLGTLLLCFSTIAWRVEAPGTPINI